MNRCFHCKNGLETCNHLLLGCHTSHKLQSMVLGLLGLSCVMAGTTIAELLAWEGVGCPKKAIGIIPLTIFWVIWNIRIIVFDV